MVPPDILQKSYDLDYLLKILPLESWLDLYRPLIQSKPQDTENFTLVVDQQSTAEVLYKKCKTKPVTIEKLMLLIEA